MATIKHLANKNRSCAEAYTYLTTKFDEHTNRPVLDEEGLMIPREGYLIDAIGVSSPSSFGRECSFLNHMYGKNIRDNEIRSHHFIISFDPKDRDLGLTPESAQELGMEMAKKYFAGYQALVCTHPDGHNRSGNIHVHIVINSVRKDTIQKPDFIEREGECKAGSKFRASKIFMKSIKSGVMEICQRENLNQVDLLRHPEEKISEREYRKKQREQKKLDSLNKEIISGGMVPAKTEYQTEKEKIRRAVRRPFTGHRPKKNSKKSSRKKTLK